MKAYKVDFDKMVPEKPEMSGCIVYMLKSDSTKGFMFGSGHGFLYPWKIFPSGSFEPFGGFEITEVSEEVVLEKFTDTETSFKTMHRIGEEFVSLPPERYREVKRNEY